MAKLSAEIERDVKEEMHWHRGLDASYIAVSANGGVVSLTGFVKSYEEKYQAERAAKRVAGVSAVANDIEVRLPNIDQRPDSAIARDAVASLRSRLPISCDFIRIVVNDGWVTLEGEVEGQNERRAAERAIRRINGVKDVTDRIEIRQTTEPIEIKQKIQTAFQRNAQVGASGIGVEAHGGEVVLEGTVRSWLEREEAERVAWSAPGVTRVKNRIAIRT